LVTFFLTQEKRMTFRSALLASAAILSAGSAFAADLPARVAPAPYIAAPLFTWTGFYVGLNAGGAWSNNDNAVNFGGYGLAFNPVFGNNWFGGNSNNDAVFTGGVTAGYNWQMGTNFVAGVEADLNYIDRGGNGNGIVPAAILGAPRPGTIYSINRGDGDNYFGTLRARLGYSFDRSLIFVTGGLAFGGNTGDTSVVAYGPVVNPPPAVLPAGLVIAGDGNNNSNIGWALGAGYEYAFSNAWSLKIEYLHVDLGSRSATFRDPNGPVGSFISINNDNKFDIVRAGVNFRF